MLELCVRRAALLGLVPVFLAAALVSNLFLAGDWFYNTTLALQLGFYAFALIGFVAEKRGVLAKPLTVPLYFMTVNMAALNIDISCSEFFSDYHPQDVLLDCRVRHHPLHPF